MKKLLFMILICSQAAFALNIDSLQAKLDAGKYDELCDTKLLDAASAAKDEAALSIYGDACARTDWINRLSAPITLLRATPEGRTNAVVFATLLYKKKLLQAALIDGLDITMIALPHIDNVISEIYDDYISGNYEKSGDVYEFKKDSQMRRLWVDKSIIPAKLKLEITDGDKKEIKEYY